MSDKGGEATATQRASPRRPLLCCVCHHVCSSPGVRCTQPNPAGMPLAGARGRPISSPGELRPEQGRLFTPLVVYTPRHPTVSRPTRATTHLLASRRPGFLPQPPTQHSPPLLFQIEHDPAENVRVHCVAMHVCCCTCVRGVMPASSSSSHAAAAHRAYARGTIPPRNSCPSTRPRSRRC